MIHFNLLLDILDASLNKMRQFQIRFNDSFGPTTKSFKITLIAYPIAQNSIRICLGKYFTGIEM